jgi:F420-dependent oxidoreductase-like protein
MRFGINGTGLVAKASVAAVVADAERARAQGFTSYWLAEHPTGGFDALTVLALVGQQVPDIELGTAVIPTWPRHPMVLAGQATTVANAIDGRLCLGIGLSHEVMMAQLGIGFDKPIRHLREYLAILMPLLERGEVEVDGSTLSCHAKAFRAPERGCQVVVAALGPQALKVAGTLADGVSLAWVGPRTIRAHIVPRLGEAAAAAGRAPPRVIATLPLCVTDDPAGVRATIDRNLAMYGQLPSYRAMLDREGAATPGDVAIVGSAAEVQDGLARLREAGVTDYAASAFARTPAEREHTAALLQQVAQDAARAAS